MGMAERTDNSRIEIHKKLHGLDHLRALAILLVFMFHYQILSSGQPGWLPEVARFGWTGVDLFFVLSGFLISSQLFFQIKQGRTPSLKEFFVKRFFRILPAFWVVVAIYFCVPFFREKEALPPIWKFLTFTQNFGLNLGRFGTFSHAWSLCVEEHFYLLLPFILVVLQRAKLFHRSYWLLIALFLFGFVIRTYSFNNLYLPRIGTESAGIDWYKYIYYPTYNRLDGLLAGVGIAAVYRFLPDLWERMSRFGNLYIVLGLLVLTGACFLCEDAQSYQASIYGFPLIAIGYGLMTMGAVSPVSFLYKWNSKVTAYIATLSYAIYLTHKGVIHMTHLFFADRHIDIDGNLLFVICIITSTLGAVVLHRIIEKPFMKWREKIIKPKQNPDS